MNRRKFLQGTLATLALPAFIGRAFADPACDAKSRLARAFRRAAKSGKPLLVLVIPTDRGEVWARGRLLGSYLNHADDKQLAPIALAEVACATMKELHTIVPHRMKSDPLMVLVETVSVPAQAIPFAPPPSRNPFQGRGDAQQDVDADIDADIAAVARIVRQALLPDAATIDRRARQNRARLSTEQLAATDDPTALPEVIDRAAAVLFSQGGAEDRLARAAAERLRLHAVPGSNWASSHGCGTTIEGVPDDEQRMVACGMGHVPAKATRFLYFFVQNEIPVE